MHRSVCGKYCMQTSHSWTIYFAASLRYNSCSKQHSSSCLLSRKGEVEQRSFIYFLSPLLPSTVSILVRTYVRISQHGIETSNYTFGVSAFHANKRKKNRNNEGIICKHKRSSEVVRKTTASYSTLR